MVYKPTYNWGGPSCIYIYIYISFILQPNSSSLGSLETLRGGWAIAVAAVAVLPGDLNAGRAQGTVIWWMTNHENLGFAIENLWFKQPKMVA